MAEARGLAVDLVEARGLAVGSVTAAEKVQGSETAAAPEMVLPKASEKVLGSANSARAKAREHSAPGLGTD